MKLPTQPILNLYWKGTPMTISISGAASPTDPSSSISPVHSAHKVAAADDTVKLSMSEQAQRLSQPSDPVEQIATNLNSSTAIFESYLGIQVAAAPAPVPPPQPQAKNISISATSGFTKDR
jgi:hypothetical protein